MRDLTPRPAAPEVRLSDHALDQGGLAPEDQEVTSVDRDADLGPLESPDMETVQAPFACTEGMDCLMMCETRDDPCHQNCIDSALHDWKVDLRGLKRCIDVNQCTDQRSVLIHCAFALLSCEDLQGQNSCAETGLCLQACGEDALCAWNCARNGDEQARGETVSWSRCLANQGCETLHCDQCNFDTSCQGANPNPNPNPNPNEIHVCSSLAICFDRCNQDPACQQACKARAEAQVVEVFENLERCDQQNGCFGDQSCRSIVCADQMRACGLPLVGIIPNENPSILTCMELNLCVEDCPVGNALCATNCELEASEEARLIYNQLKSCIIRNSCNSRECLRSFCGEELRICAFH
ncbi:MAG: hypothetical protein VYD19_04595 [Myxococcota bacterium]|nr:hypothetical protein [Myxococcota bacterium]